MTNLPTPARALAWISAALLMARVFAATHVGFGDAEALYATYALVPQPAYLDHPGLIGAIARLLGGAGAPTPSTAHWFTAVLCTLIPYVGVFASRLAGASKERSAVAGLALLAAPEISVGLFGFTPDILLAPLWLLATGLVAAAIRSTGTRSLYCFLGAGAAMGLACDAKASGTLLPLAFLVFLASKYGRPHARTKGPWLALAMTLLLVLPVIVFEAQHGAPLLRHRFVSTQSSAGFSLRNAAALLGGQLAYLSPLVAIAVAILVRKILREPEDETTAWLRIVTVVSLAMLVPLCLWSRVAEPHWIAPAWLALPIYFAGHASPSATKSSKPSVPLVSQKLAGLSLATGLLFTAIAHLWVLSDWAPKLLGASYQAKYDLANDMHAWERIIPAIKRERASAQERSGTAPIIVTPHWMVAAQISAALGKDVAVTTTSEIPDDFQQWLPAYLWDRQPEILWVTDDRFPEARPHALDNRSSAGVVTVNILRGHQVVRRVKIEVLRLDGVG